MAGAHGLTEPMRLDPETARSAFVSGGSVLCLGVPPGTELGIDFASFTVGPRFQGIKLIPPGLHFLYASARDTATGAVGPRTGFFFRASAGSVLVIKWDKAAEEFQLAEAAADVGLEQARRLAAGVRRFEFDAGLGAYPLHAPVARAWLEHSRHVSVAGCMERLLRRPVRRRSAPPAAASGGPVPPCSSPAGAGGSPAVGLVWDGGAEGLAAMHRAAEAGREAEARARAGGGAGLRFAGMGDPDGVVAAVLGAGMTGEESAGAGASSSSSSAAAAAAARSTEASGAVAQADLEASARERARALGWLDPRGAPGTEGDTAVPLGLGQELACAGIPGLTSREGGAAAVTAYALDTTSALDAVLAGTASSVSASPPAVLPAGPAGGGVAPAVEECGPSSAAQWAAVCLVGELEASFLGLLLGHRAEALERWKGLVDCLCRAEAAMLASGAEAGPPGGEAMGADEAEDEDDDEDEDDEDEDDEDEDDEDEETREGRGAPDGAAGEQEAKEDDKAAAGVGPSASPGPPAPSTTFRPVYGRAWLLASSMRVIARQLVLAPPDFLGLDASLPGGGDDEEGDRESSSDSTHFVKRAVGALDRTLAEAPPAAVHPAVARAGRKLVRTARRRFGWHRRAPGSATGGDSSGVRIVDGDSEAPGAGSSSSAPSQPLSPEDVGAALAALRASGAFGDGDDPPVFVV